VKDYVPIIQTTLWIALIVAAILMFRAPVYERIKRGSSIKIGSFELGQLADKVDVVQQQVNELGSRVSELFLLTMSPPMYANLEKFATGSFGKYVLDEPLKRELYHLRDIGYVDIPAIRAIPYEGANLSDHVEVTTTGRRFVELRKLVKVTAGN
jgi:hypothetical protein